MKRILTRIGTFLLAMLMLLSIPLVAFAVPENEVQEFSVSVNDELSNEYPDVYDAEPYDYDSAYDDSDEYDYDDDWGYETTDNDDHYSDPDAPELYLEEAAGSESAIEALSAPIFIHSQSDMVAFLNGGLGPNHGHFILEWSGALPVGALRGRGFVDGQPFTGIFDGNNNVISNLHLSPRGLTEPEATAALNDIGLFRVLGHGATIRNLTLQGAAYTDTISIADWNTVTGSIGLLAGRVMPGAHVIISDIDIVSSNMSFGGGRTLNNKRVGGLVGVVDVGSRLDITGITIGTESASGVTITLNITGTPGTNTANRNLQSAGGIIGMTAGSVNILGSQNAVNVVISNLNTGGSRVIQHAGGAIGRTTGSAHVDINNLTVRGTIGAQQMAGGLIGSTLTAGTTTIRGSTNYAAVTVGGSNTHVGGFIGWARNRTYIRDSVNRGNITHLGSGTSSNANAFGGFLGRAQGILEMHNVENIAPVQKTGGGRSRGGGIVGWSNNLINITGAVNHGNVGSTAGTAGGNLNSGLGGILGYVQFAGAATNRWVNLTNTENHGDIGFNAAGVAASRLRNGGIVGATRTRSGVRGLVITNALNTGRIQAAQVAGGILGWNQSDRTNISGVMNRGNVNVTTVGANGCAGGIVGRSARHDLTIFQSANEGNITAGASGSSSNTALSGVGGIVGNINRGTRNRILQSYNAGSVTGGTVTVGGIIGQIRRGGTTLIQDSYNIGTVNSRRGNHGTSGAPRWSGHGILGHRGSAPTVTIERVYNAGNVSGRPIFGYSTTNQATRRMVYRNVFWDMDIYIGNQRQDSVRGIAPGITGLYTAILTSGHVSGLNSGAWLVNGWLSPDGQTMVNQQWESYPYLSWQTGGVLQTEFFTRIDPGASHTVEANPTIVNFTGVASNVRTFNPYTVRPTAGHAGHPVHPVGNSTLSVTRLVNQRLSVGLISPNGVVGFGENELFEAVVMAVDAINGRVINHARLYQNGVFIEPQQHGFADGTTVTLADNLNAIALGYVVAPNWVLTQDMIDDGLIRIYMDRVPIDNIHVHVRNLTAVEDVPPRIHVDRNPALTRNNAPVLRQGTGSTPFFNISGAMWGDLLYASAHHFEAEDPYNPVAEFWFEMIIGGAGTAASPWIVAMDLHDIDLGSFTMEVVRTHDDGINEDGVTTRLPHGGRAPGFSELSNPTRSNNFLVEFRSRSEVAENPRGLAGSGTGTGTTNVANQWTVQGTTTNTEVRITPNWGQQIGGTGQNFSYRTTGWHFISDLVDHDDDGNILRLLRVPVEPEIAMNVRVVEEFTVRGMPWTVLIPSSELTLRYDADCGEEPSGEAILRSHVIPPSTPPGTFAPRLIAGDFLDASAPEFLTNTHEVDEGELYPDLFPTPPAGTVRDPIYITLTRAPAGVVHGFVLNATMLDDFDSPHAPISGARVTILNELGQVVGTAITGADGYYRFSGLATGQNYTVIATADNFGSGLGVPTPVYLPVGENAESHVFLRHNDSANGFMILLNIREMGTANNLGGYPTTAVLTYGTDNTRDSMFASPFRLIQTHVNTSLWREGEIEVLINRTGFVPRVTIEDIGEYIDAQAEHVAQGFILIDVEVPTTRITFNIYGSMKNNAPGAVPARVQNYFPDGEDGYVNQIIVPVVFGEPLCPLAMEPIIAWMGEQESGFAFWGWFTEEALDASGRSRNSYRRPTVGTNGFDISRVFTEELFNTYADADNNINLNAIWVLWGDVNDDDQVNGIDVSLVSQYVRRFPGISIVEPAAYVSRGPAITGLDVSLISQYVRRFPGIVLGQPLGRTLVLGAQMGLPDISAPEIWNRASAFDGTTAVDIGFREMPVLAANAPQTRSGGGTLRNTIGAHQIWSVSHEIGYRGDYVDIRLRMDQITAQGMCWTMFVLDFDTSVLSNPRLSPRIDREELTPDLQEAYDSLTGTLFEVVLGPLRGGNAMTHNMIFEGVVGSDPGEVIVSWQSNPNPEIPDNFTSGIFVDIRFDILPGAPIGISPVTISPRPNDVFLAGVGSIVLPVVLESFTNGSVAVVVDIPQIRVVDAQGALISNALLTAARSSVTPVPGMTITADTGVNAGRFAVAGATVGDVFTASAANFANNTHTLTAAEAAGLLNGTITYIEIVLPLAADMNRVQFWRNYGANALHTTAFVADGNTVLPPDNPTRAGHIFRGWYTNPETTARFNFGTPINGNLELYARWETGDGPNIHTVLFFRNDNSGNLHYAAFVEEGSTVLPPANPLREEHTFRNWYTAPAATLATRFDFGTLINGNRQLYAGWDDGQGPVVHTVLFHRNDNSGNIHYAAFVRHGNTVAAPAIPILANQLFAGWHTNTSGTAPFNFETPITAATNLHADWTDADQHRVRFFMNYGDNALHATVMVDDGRTVMPPANPTREGYTFSGWYRTRTAATADRFSFGTPITENLDLYARWTIGVNPPVHTVLFQRNDDSGNLHYAAFVIEGQRAPVPSDPVLADHLFVGWHINPVGNTLFNFNTPIMSELNLYADWHADTDPYYAVVFRMNDGTYAIHYVAFVPPGSTVLPPANPLREEHTFRNWYTAPAATLATRFDFGTLINGNRQLYAGWDDGSGPIVHTVLFHRNDNSGNIHYAAFVRHGNTVTAPAIPTLANQLFAGWHTNTSGTAPFNFETPITAATNLHADWTDADQHRVRFFMNYGDNALHATVMVDDGRTVMPPANPTREGYTFSGWYRTRTAATADRFSFGTPITENLDLYARWTPGVNPPVHTVLFHRNDDSGNLHYAAFVIEGQRAPVPSDPVLAGHLFIGWHTSQAGNTLFNFNTPIMSALNLHADWHADADPYYAVVFRMNDGTYAIHYVAFVPPGSTVLPPTNPLRDDHTFRNWYTAPAATMATRFNFGTAITQNLALYAGWDDGSGPIVHTVLFHRNDNSGDLHYAAFVRHGSLVIAPANPTHEHHTFTGWHRTPTGSTLFDFSTPIESGLSLHANWRDDAETQHLIRFWMNDGTGDNGRGGLVAYAEVPNERTVTPPYPNPTREYTQILMNPVIPQPDEDDEEDDEYYEDDKYDKDDEYYADDDNIIDEDVVTEDDLKDEDAVVDDENDILDDAKTDEDEHIDDDSVIADDAAAEDETEYETEASNDDTYVITQGSGYVSEMLEQAITFEFIENVIIYTFYGWYTCPSNDPQYRFDFGTLITEPLDLYARWERFAAEEIEITHTVLLHRNDGSENLFYAAFVPDGKILADYMPASNPLRAGYEFTGWFRDQEATELFTDAEKALTVGESFELFAGWAPIVIEPEEFTVTFRRNDGSEDVYFTAIVRDGQRVSEPTNPTRIGFTFQGWYTNAAATQRFDFQTAIRSDLNLFAGWAPIVIEPEEFTVTFRRNDGSEEVHFTAIVRDGQRVSEPTNPTRIGFTFQGWYTDAAATQRFDFQTEIRSDLNLFARWRAIVWGGNGGGTQRVVLPELEVPLAQFTQYHNAFIIGFPDRTVRPHATLTRAEVVTMLFRLLDDDYRSRVWSQSNTFADVHASQWFNNAISTMANAGILNRDELFRPNDAVTRAEFASMVARFFDEVEAPETPFNDTNGHWAEDYINRVAQFGWVQGMGDGRFEPDGEMTRAEAAAIINRMLGRIVDSEADLLTGRTRWPDTTNRNAWYYLYMQEATHSTEFERLENGTVRWTEILTNLDWTVLERMDSTPDSITAARAVQQVAEA